MGYYSRYYVVYTRIVYVLFYNMFSAHLHHAVDRLRVGIDLPSVILLSCKSSDFFIVTDKCETLLDNEEMYSKKHGLFSLLRSLL